jgi:hypothetical protein
MKLKGIELKGTYKVIFYDTCFEIYDERGKEIYFENNGSYWSKKEYDDEGYWVYFEDSFGYIVDKRVKELTVKEIEKILGYKVKIKE